MSTLDTVTAGAVLAIDVRRGCIWFCQQDGTLKSAPLDSSDGTPLTDRPTLEVGIVALAVNEKYLVAAYKNATLSIANPDDIEDSKITVRLEAFTPAQLALLGSSSSIVGIVPRDGSALFVAPAEAGPFREILVPFLCGITVHDEVTYVASNSGPYQRGEISTLTGNSTTLLVSGLPRITRLGTQFGARSILAVHQHIGCVSSVNLENGSVETYGPLGTGEMILEAQGLPGGRIALMTGHAFKVLDQIRDMGKRAYVEKPLPIFISSWTRLFFSMGTNSVDPGQLQFRVPDGSTAGMVSYTKENGLGDPVPLLVTGGLVGDHQVEMLDDGGNLLASTVFSITTKWDSLDEGPPGYYFHTGLMDSGVQLPPPTRPQNLGAYAHSGAWKMLILMVDTSTARWPLATRSTDQAAILGHVINGANGTARSARRYYEENSAFRPASATEPSGHGLTLAVHNGQPFGPVVLPDAWTDYFHTDPTLWISKETTLDLILHQALIDGIITTADFSWVNVIMIVPRSPGITTGSMTDQFVWPHARYKKSHSISGDTKHPASADFAEVWVPLDFDVHDTSSRQMHSTLSHELGHTLDLPDLYSKDEYSQDIKDRIVEKPWDLMAGSSDLLGHFSVSNKMRQGWLTAADIKLVDFQGTTSINESYTLHASDLGVTPPPMFKAIEARITNGRNYYVEYRSRQASFISDQITPDRQVIITDVISDNYPTPTIQPPVLFVPKDADFDGPKLDNGDDFEEKNPATHLDARIEVTAMEADHAVVKVTYGSDGKPEPGIRPWREELSNWQSPDIEVRNAKSVADPAYHNIPWLGHKNTVVAKIRNSGTLTCVNLRVQLLVVLHTTDDQGWLSLSFDTHDVAPTDASDTPVDFTREWVPPTSIPRNSHFCIKAEIQPYQDPSNPLILDNNFFNNAARSNYTTLYSGSASPSSRVGSEIHLGNPYARPAIVSAVIKKTHPYHRVFTTNRWLRVGAKTTRTITVWDEAIDLSQELPDVDKRLLYKVPNLISVVGYVNTPYDEDCLTPVKTGGVGLQVFARRATVVHVQRVSQASVEGRVDYVDTQGTVMNTGGRVLVEMIPVEGEGAGEYTVLTTLNSDGRFVVKFDVDMPVRPKLRAVIVHYLGAGEAAPAESEEVRLTD